MSDTEEQLKRMVMTFRVSELQMLLGYAGKNKTGRKNELQSRALETVRLRNQSIHQKIRELYKSIQLEMMSFGERAQSGTTQTTGNIMPNQRVPSALNQNIASNYQAVNSYSRNQQSQVSNMTNFTNLQSTHNYPLSPDVRLKKLPFYDVLGELLKPSTLAPQGSGRYQEAAFTFCLTPQQAHKIASSRDLRPGRQDYTIQVQLRFCLLETTSEQEDTFPPNVTVKVNDKMCPLPSPIPTNKAGVEPKRPSRSVNMTALCKISPTVTNRIHVAWSSEYGRCYVISVYLVQKLTSEDLLQRLKTKGPRLADFTKSLIKQKLREDGECEIATTSLRCSLLCPLGKMRMQLPCRAETCIHLQCFDASLFLLMNERKPTWTCPVCDKPALYDNLVIDGYFQEVLQDGSDCTEVTLHQDGNWTPLIVKKEPKETPTEKRKEEVSVETLSDDSDDGGNEADDSVIEEVCKKRKKDVDVEIITLDSEDEQEPPNKRQAGFIQDSAPGTSPNANGSEDSSQTLNNGSGNTDGSNSKESWCVGEVDPGKKLVFRKSLPCNATNGGSGSNNGQSQSATSPSSNRSGSPQIICLDSPSESPRPSQPSQDDANSTQNSAPPQSSYSTESSSTSSQAVSSLSTIGNDLIPLEDSLQQSTQGSQYSDPLSLPMSSSYMMQDPLSTNNVSLIPLSSTSPSSSSSYSGVSGMYNPVLGADLSQSPNSNIPFRPQDRFL